MLAAVVAGNLVRLPLLSAGGKSAPLLPLDLTVAAFVLLGLMEARRHRRFEIDEPTVLGGLFLCTASLSLATSGERLGLQGRELLFGGAYLVRWALGFGVYVTASTWLSARDAMQVARALRVAIAIFAAFGLMQVLFFPGFAQMVYPDSALVLDWDPQGRRLVSTFLDPNYAGILLVIGLCLWGGAHLAGAYAPVWEGILLGSALALTLSRGSALAGVVAAITMLALRGATVRAARLSVGALLALVAAIPLLLPYAAGYDKLFVDGSALQRVLAWDRAVALVADHPWLGIGFNTVGFVSSRYGWVARGTSGFGLDGGLLFIAALTGVVGLVAFVALLWSMARSARQTWVAIPDIPAARGIALAVPASIVAVTVQATFANTLLLSLVIVPCWLLWALPRALRRQGVASAGESANYPTDSRERMGVNHCSRVLASVRATIADVIATLPSAAVLGRTPALLDVGCWDGEPTVEYAARLGGADMSGLEIFPQPAAAARGRGIRVESLDLERDRWPQETASIDVIVCNQVLEHLKNIWLPLHEMARVTRPGGHLLVSVPNLASLHNRLLLLFGRQPTSIRIVGPHVRGYALGDLRQLLQAQGTWVVRRVIGVGFPPLPAVAAAPVARLWPSASHTPVLLCERTARPVPSQLRGDDAQTYYG